MKSCLGILSRRRAIIIAMAMLAFLPIGASDAGWLSDVFKGSSKQDKATKRAGSPKPAASPKPHIARIAAPKAAAPKPSASKPVAPTCDFAKFRIVVDVGHTAESEGATSARNVSEFAFNLRLARRIEQQLKAEGFLATKLLLTEGKARASLVRRVAAANNWPANLFLSIHHDSVPDKMLENWEFEGKKSHFSDRFSGYSVFVSHRNPDFKTSFSFAELLAREMKAQGLKYAEQYSQPIMGRYRHPLLQQRNRLSIATMSSSY